MVPEIAVVPDQDSGYASFGSWKSDLSKPSGRILHFEKRKIGEIGFFFRFYF